MKRAPVQGYSAGIPWDMHLRAYDAYCKRYSPQEALIQGGCRGGFGTEELDIFIPGWREELDERKALATRIEALEQALRTATLTLAAALSLLEAGGKQAAASDKIFAMMLDDYRDALAIARAALAQTGEPTG